jgi:hypothetical protein
MFLYYFYYFLTSRHVTDFLYIYLDIKTGFPSMVAAVLPWFIWTFVGVWVPNPTFPSFGYLIPVNQQVFFVFLFFFDVNPATRFLYPICIEVVNNILETNVHWQFINIAVSSWLSKWLSYLLFVSKWQFIYKLPCFTSRFVQKLKHKRSINTFEI